MLPADVLERLVNLRRQHDASMRGIERLRDEHKDWQKCFDDLLANINEKDICDTVLANPGADDRRTKLVCVAPVSGDMGAMVSGEPFSSEHPGFPSAMPSASSENPFPSECNEHKDFPSVHNTRRADTGHLHRVVKQELEQVTFTLSRRPGDERFAQFQRKVRRIVQSNRFEIVTGCVIFVNLILVGLEAQTSLMNDEEFPAWSWPWVSERIFLLIYCVELFLRFLAGSTLFNDFWFMTDSALVVVGVFALVILPLTVGEIADVGAEKILLVRGIRLLRLVRALRMFKHFKVMWRLVNGLLTAGKTLVSTSLLILISLFIFSCMAVELIAKDDHLANSPQTQAIVHRHFWGVDLSMMTLMQFVTLDSAASIYFPIVLERPLLSLYFLVIIFVISIGLMNLVTAVVLENAMESAAEEAEELRTSLKTKVKQALPELLSIFQQLDKDQSGILTRDEMECVDDNLLPRRLLDSACVGSMLDFFDFLDVEEKGELNQEEFVEGLLSLCLLDMPISAIQTLKLLQTILTLNKKIDQNVEALRSLKASP